MGGAPDAINNKYFFDFLISPVRSDVALGGIAPTGRRVNGSRNAPYLYHLLMARSTSYLLAIEASLP